MKINLKNIFMCILIFIIIIFSFEIPKVLFEIEDIRMTKGVYKKAKTKNKIDVQAQNVYLVNVIHDIDMGYYNIEIAESIKGYNLIEKSTVDGKEVLVETVELQQIKKEMEKLETYNIVNELIEDKGLSNIAIAERKYQKSNTKYMVKRIKLETNGRQINVDIEEKTGKIIFLWFNGIEKIQQKSEEEIMKNYIQYLDLYIIDDWKMENNKLKSEKAQLEVSLNFYDNSCILGIHSINRSKNY